MKVDIHTRISDLTDTSYVTVRVIDGENELAAKLSGWFLNYRIRKTIERFKKTLEMSKEKGLENEKQ